MLLKSENTFMTVFCLFVAEASKIKICFPTLLGAFNASMSKWYGDGSTVILKFKFDVSTVSTWNLKNWKGFSVCLFFKQAITTAWNHKDKTKNATWCAFGYLMNQPMLKYGSVGTKCSTDDLCPFCVALFRTGTNMPSEHLVHKVGLGAPRIHLRSNHPYYTGKRSGPYSATLATFPTSTMAQFSLVRFTWER